MKDKLFYKIPTMEVRHALEGLAYWVADVNYIKERFDANDPEYSKADKSIHLCFDTLDSLNVPFWVQNTVICYAEDWRRYQENYMWLWMRDNRNIIA